MFTGPNAYRQGKTTDTRRGAGSHVTTVLVILLLAAGVAIVAWRAVTHGASTATGPEQNPATIPVAVEVAPIDSGLMREIRVLSGTLEASTRFDVAAKVGGLIRKINVDLGDIVEPGQVVAELDDDEYVQAVAQAEAERAVRQAEVAQAHAELERVNRDYERLEALRQRGAASDLEFSDVLTERASQEAAIALADARVRQAEAALELANIRLAYTIVRATWQGGPERGTVAERFEDAGNTVQAGDLILSVVGLDPLKAVVSVTEGDYARLRVGQEATLTTEARPGETFDATVARIAPIFRESSRQAQVELLVENSEGLLRPGMFIRLRVVLREAQADIIVPSAAVVQRSGLSIVFTVDEGGGTVTEHPVDIGIVQDERVQIVSPPLQGPVVVLGQHLLEDGATITISD